ncbi:endonuclease/exonuclease/phosphatase family protein [Pontibacter sp. G13]|uniref:endonuclease/exonuclease/phosphatase family protein n=1 Tax=Pontibacter sp. G13 TaxID=3074898 RepID=UPI002889CA6A|nr:endonuclease/exonuclease/phosphatase family protein [Pontibacter sp. G13]WNJ19278.1 endonuclease/exonuclease/phosphatase family protein [Pontibacter sp. G13]
MNRLWERIWLLIRMTVCIMAGVTLLGLLGGNWSIWLELMTHFKLHMAAVACLTLFASWTRKSHVWMAVSGFLVVVNFADVWPIYPQPAPPPPSEQEISLIALNVLKPNKLHQRASDYLLKEDPDILILTELTHVWCEGIEELRDHYPHEVWFPQHGFFGVAILSKYPVVDWKHLELVDHTVTTLQADIDLGGDTVRVYGVHPPAPPRYQEMLWRDAHFVAFGELIPQSPYPVLMAGDLNSTSYSPKFKQLLKSTGLVDSRRGIGVQPSWPGKLAFMGITLDHCLHDPSITIRDRGVGPPVGSDHLPLKIRFSMPKTE